MDKYTQAQLLVIFRRLQQRLESCEETNQVTLIALEEIAGNCKRLVAKLQASQNHFTTMQSDSLGILSILRSIKTCAEESAKDGPTSGPTESGHSGNLQQRVLPLASTSKDLIRKAVKAARTKAESRPLSSLVDPVNPKIKYQVQIYKPGFMEKAIKAATEEE